MSSKTPTSTPGDVLPPTVRPEAASSAVIVDLPSLSQQVRPEYLAPGTSVRGWVVVDRLGAGGMGAVYKVRDDSESPPLVAALKVSLPPADESEAARADRVTRFEREAGVILQLSHPNIIKGLSYFLWKGHPCLVMPFVEGETLMAYCRKHHPSLRRVFGELFRPVADALDYIHEKSIFHRDIKPANIMVADGRPLLMDFGIARSKAATTLTHTEVLCTPEYTAPEHLVYSASMERAADEEVFLYTPETDLFCLGATFLELLTGRLPYQHLPTSKAGFLDPRFQAALREFEPLRVSACNPGLPEDVDELFRRLMSREPEERFRSGSEVVDAIDEFLARHADDGAFDVPFAPPERQRVSQAPAPTTADRRRSSAVVPPPPPLTAVASSVAAPSVAASRAVAPSVAFRPPTRAPAAGFESPARERPPAPARDVEPQLPTAIREAQKRLAPAAESGSRKFIVFALLGGGLLVILLVAAIGTTAAPNQPGAPQPTSLLDEPSTPPVVAPPLPLAAVPMPVPTADAGVGQQPLAPPAVVAKESVVRGSRTDSAAIDEILKSEYGGKRPVVRPEGEAQPSQAEENAPPAPAPPSWLKVSAAPKHPAAAAGSKKYSVPLGTEISVRLQKPLDSRTVSSGPVVARLMRPLVVRGAAVFSAGTMAYGTATATNAGRFDIRFTRLKLSDGTEVPFSGIAYDADDKKPGVRATSRQQGSGPSSPGVGEAIVKGAASTLLGKVPSGDATDVARGAGQTVLNQPDVRGGSAGDALLLEAPADFVIFVAESF